MQPHDTTPKPSEKVECACHHCGALFTEYPSRVASGRGKFCSQTCHYAAHDRRVEIKCQNCGITFLAQGKQALTGARKYCSTACYEPHIVGGKAKTLDVIFWSRVAKGISPNDCWLWNRRCDKDGYGIVYGKKAPPYFEKSAHRLSWVIHFGPIPDGLWVLHNCPDGDNPTCVNPAHLWLGTTQDNTADRDAKCRQAKGERNGWNVHPEARLHGSLNGFAKLTEAQVSEIRQNYVKGITKQRDLASQYNISQYVIWAIVNHKRWLHVE